MPRSIRPALLVALLALTVAASSFAQSPQQLSPDATRYMALGDSIAAGYQAQPVSNGYTFRLYQDGVFDTVPHTLFNNAAVPGMTSGQVLAYQVPQAIAPNGFHPKYVTLTVGGNDLLALVNYALTHDSGATLLQAQQTITAFGQNLGGILLALRTGLPDAKIFVANQYTIPSIQAEIPVTDQIVDTLNGIVAQLVGQFPGVYLVDVHSAFLGRDNLIQSDRNYASAFDVHPTNVGYRVMEQAFAAVIAANK